MAFSLPVPNHGISPISSIIDLHSLNSQEARLIHLLLGISDFVHDLSKETVSQKYNYAVLGIPRTIRRKGVIQRLLQEQGIDIGQLDVYLIDHLGQNEFYSEILDEFLLFFFNSQRNRHTQAFLHLYRALERISYVFPIVYASISTDYKNTFKQLKGFLKDDKSGELSFFNSFVQELIDNATLSTQVGLDVTDNTLSIQQTHYNSLKKIFNARDIRADVPDTFISVEYRSLISAFITVRNRYFHFLSGNSSNLTSKDILDSDEFFSILNPVFCNWLSYIYFRILESRIK